MENSPVEVAFVPVFNDEGFLVGVYKKDDSDHHHHWMFDGDGEGAVCHACQLHIRVYTVQEALELNGPQKLSS
jgi:hypothetical protein